MRKTMKDDFFKDVLQFTTDPLFQANDSSYNEQQSLL